MFQIVENRVVNHPNFFKGVVGWFWNHPEFFGVVPRCGGWVGVIYNPCRESPHCPEFRSTLPNCDLLEWSRRSGCGVLEVSRADISGEIKRACVCEGNLPRCWSSEFDVGDGVKEHGNNDEVDDDREDDAKAAKSYTDNATSIRFLFLLDDNWSRCSLWCWWWSVGWIKGSTNWFLNFVIKK